MSILSHPVSHQRRHLDLVYKLAHAFCNDAARYAKVLKVFAVDNDRVDILRCTSLSPKCNLIQYICTSCFVNTAPQLTKEGLSSCVYVSTSCPNHELHAFTLEIGEVLLLMVRS
jgi:hypothetical protein